MSEATLRDPQARAAHNHWYLYFDRDPVNGPYGCVRAIIEEVCDEIWSGDGGPTRQRRRVFLDAENMRDMPGPERGTERAAYDGFDWRIENCMTDEEFQQLIADGIVVPIKAPQTPTAS